MRCKKNSGEHFSGCVCGGGGLCSYDLQWSSSTRLCVPALSSSEKGKKARRMEQRMSNWWLHQPFFRRQMACNSNKSRRSGGLLMERQVFLSKSFKADRNSKAFYFQLDNVEGCLLKLAKQNTVASLWGSSLSTGCSSKAIFVLMELHVCDNSIINPIM